MRARRWLAAGGLALCLLAIPLTVSADNFGAFRGVATASGVASAGAPLGVGNRTVSGQLNSGQTVTYTINYTPGIGADGGVAPWLASLRADVNPGFPGALNFWVTDSKGVVIGTSALAQPFQTPDVADPSVNPAQVLNGYFVTQNPGPVTISVANFQPGPVAYTLTLYPA